MAGKAQPGETKMAGKTQPFGTALKNPRWTGDSSRPEFTERELIGSRILWSQIMAGLDTKRKRIRPGHSWQQRL